MDVVIGALGDPPLQAKEGLMLRIMQENGDFRLQNEELKKRLPCDLGLLFESINRIAIAPGTPAIQAAAEAALVRMLGDLPASTCSVAAFR